MRDRSAGPCEGKLRIEANRGVEEIRRARERFDALPIAGHDCESAEIGIVGRGVLRWFAGQRRLLDTGQRRAKRIGYALRDFAFHGKDIGERPIIRLRPKVGIGLRFDQLDIDPDAIARFLHASFKNVSDAELLRDLEQVLRRTLVAKS